MNARRAILLGTLVLLTAGCLAHLVLRDCLASLEEEITDSETALAIAGRHTQRLTALIAKLKAPPPVANAAARGSPVASPSAVWMRTVATQPALRSMWLKQVMDHTRLHAQPILSRLGYSPEKREAYYAIVEKNQERLLNLHAEAAQRGVDLNDPGMAQEVQSAASEGNAAIGAFFGPDLQAWNSASAAGTTLEFVLDQALDPTYSPAEQAELRDILAQHRSAGPGGESDYDWDAVSEEAHAALGPDRSGTFTTAVQWIVLRQTLDRMRKGR